MQPTPACTIHPPGAGERPSRPSSPPSPPSGPPASPRRPAASAATPAAAAARPRRRRGARAPPAPCRTSTWPARTASAPRGTARRRSGSRSPDGVLSDVYYPTDRQHQRRDAAVRRHRRRRRSPTCRPATRRTPCGPSTTAAWRAGSPAPRRAAATRLVTDYFTDPRARQRGDADPTLLPGERRRTCSVYVRFDGDDQRQRRRRRPATQNGGADDGRHRHLAPGTPCRSRSTRRPRRTRRTATTPSRSTPPCAPTGRSRPRRSGFAGTASDGLAQLDADHAPGHRRTRRAASGNVVQTAQVDARPRPAVHRSRSASAPRRRGAVATAGGSAGAGFDRHLPRLPRGLGARTTARLSPPARRRGLTAAQRARARAARTACRRTCSRPARTRPSRAPSSPSLASPWGQAVARRRPGAMTYFGSYREVFARDLYETFTGCSPPATWRPRRTPCGSCSSASSSPTGRCRATAWSTASSRRTRFGVQLDEVAYPILMARTVGLTDKAFYTDAHQARRGLRRRARPGVRQRALGGAERVLAVDDRRRDRRPGRRRARSPSRTATPPARGSTAPPPTTTSATSRAGR